MTGEILSIPPKHEVAWRRDEKYWRGELRIIGIGGDRAERILNEFREHHRELFSDAVISFKMEDDCSFDEQQAVAVEKAVRQLGADFQAHQDHLVAAAKRIIFDLLVQMVR
jgi:hypothetical protein